MLRDAALRLGLWEASSLTYLDPQRAAEWGLENACPRIDNPISKEQSLLRSSLLPNLAAAAAANLKNRSLGACLFEWGKVFENGSGGIVESNRFAVVLAGLKQEQDWSQPQAHWDFFDAKGLLEQLGAAFDIKVKITAELSPPAWLHPGQAALVRLGKAQGWLGALHPAVLKGLGTRGEKLYAFEISDPGAAKLSGEARYRPFNRLPGVERDLSCMADESVTAAALLDFFKNDPAGRLARVVLRDVYQSESLGAGKRSLTFSFEFQPQETSLTDEDVNRMQSEMVQRLTQALPVEVR
jgi:phenylalanyl-tRNA synthetase beta chain